MNALTSRGHRAPCGVALLGPPIEHRDSFMELLAGEDFSVSWLPDYHTYRLGKGLEVQSAASRIRDQLFGTQDAEYARVIAKALTDDTRILIAYWGTIPLADLVMVRRIRPDIRIVLALICYPLSLSAAGIARQRFLVRHASRAIDGLLFPSAEMAEYFADRVSRKYGDSSGIVPPCWATPYQAVTRVGELREAPNVVYVGRTDLSGRTIHSADDMRPLLRALLEAGVEVHHGYSAETADSHPLRKAFAPRPLKELIATMSSFDASLIAYNTDVCKRAERFELTVPDRLISSVAAGVPIAIPATGYAASKSYLRDYPAVFEFKSAADLAAQLADRERVAQARARAWDARVNFVASRHSETLKQFVFRMLR